MRTRRVKTAISLIALVVILAHHFLIDLDVSKPAINGANWIRKVFKFDPTTITLAVIAILPWLAPIIKPIKAILLWLSQAKYTTWFKLIVTVIALSFILINKLWLHVTIDAFTTGLLILAALPWLPSLIESAKFPGGWEVKFRDVQAAGEKVTGGSSPSETVNLAGRPAYLSVAEQDPNLALVGLRIQIEERLRAIATKYQTKEHRSLLRLFHELKERGILNDNSMSGLQELVMAGNQAAHGASVEPSVADWAFNYGQHVLAALDAKLNG